mmetsp:Transcript_96721/g.301707  ORF Transcript_96721/g.301707 Transcript_96721/m.301707 type:complete len:408 (+) Transcript_96721:1822-3045(+)
MLRCDLTSSVLRVAVDDNDLVQQALLDIVDDLQNSTNRLLLLERREDEGDRDAQLLLALPQLVQILQEVLGVEDAAVARPALRDALGLALGLERVERPGSAPQEGLVIEAGHDLAHRLNPASGSHAVDPLAILEGIRFLAVLTVRAAHQEGLVDCLQHAAVVLRIAQTDHRDGLKLDLEQGAQQRDGGPLVHAIRGHRVEAAAAGKRHAVLTQLCGQSFLVRVVQLGADRLRVIATLRSLGGFRGKPGKRSQLGDGQILECLEILQRGIGFLDAGQHLGDLRGRQAEDDGFEGDGSIAPLELRDLDLEAAVAQGLTNVRRGEVALGGDDGRAVLHDEGQALQAKLLAKRQSLAQGFRAAHDHGHAGRGAAGQARLGDVRTVRLRVKQGAVEVRDDHEFLCLRHPSGC